MVNETLTLNMTPGTGRPVLHASQFDTGLRKFSFHIQESIPANAVATLNGLKPDGNTFSYSAYIDDEHTVSIDCTTQMTAVVGDTICKLRITNEDGQVGAANFILCVELDPSADVEPSESDIPIFEQLVGVATEKAASAKADAESAAHSAEIATQKADIATEAADTAELSKGTAVQAASSAVDAARRAEAAATEAGDSAEAAGRSEERATIAAQAAENARETVIAAKDQAVSAGNLAVASANQAHISETNAAQSAENASDSANRAQSGASAAERHEGNAREYAEAAEAAASAATNAADIAVDKADEATTAAENARNSETDAETAAQTAVTKASEASQSANTASQKSSEAVAAANIATQKSSEAVTAAGTATQKASEASQSAEIASEKATVASQSATNAANSANSASTSANTASQKATEASQSATTATNKASEATQKATEASQSAQAAAESAEQAAETLAHKADIDGNYEELTAGTAEQLLSTQKVTDSVPYIFRTSGGSVDIGNREEDEIVGGTVAWNQLVYDPNFADASNWYRLTGATAEVANNEISLNISANFGGATSTDAGTGGLISGHKYFVSITAKASNSRSGSFAFGLSDSSSHYQVRKTTSLGTAFETVAFIGTQTEGSITTGRKFMIYDTKGTSSPTVITAKNAVAVDLTAMFGSAIADYIYSLEQATAGAGVAWFRKLFPNDYYPYDAGTLKSVEGVSAHQMVGFNQWDEEWEVGTLSFATGEPATASDRIRSANFIAVIPSTTYYDNFPELARVLFYDNDKSFLGVWENNSWLSARSFDTPSDCHYIKFVMAAAYGTTYNHDICINLSHNGSRNGEYEPYEKHSYPLDSSLTLRGIPKLDSANRLYYDGDTYESDGTVTRKYGIVDLGTLNWNIHANVTGRFFASLSPKAKPSGSYNVASVSICAKYQTITQNQLFSNISGISTQALDGASVFVYDSAYTDAATFKSAMSGVYLVYELATPTTEQAEPYTNPQIVSDWGTEEYVTTGIVPVGHVTDYPANLRDKLQHLPDLADSDGYYAIKQTGTQMSLSAFNPADITTANQKADQALQSLDPLHIVESTSPASVTAFSDGADGVPMKSLIAEIAPVQDLHGQANPYPAGGGKNKLNANLIDNRAPAAGDSISVSDEVLSMAWVDGRVVGSNKNTQLISAGTYTISAVGTNINNVSVQIVLADNTVLKTVALDTATTFTTESDFYINLFGNYRNPGTAVFKIQIEAGSTATAWSPYSNICPISGWDGVEVTRAGKNLWDEVWENGIIYASGAEGPETGIRSKNYITCHPGTVFYVAAPSNCFVCFYKLDKTFLSRVNAANATCTVPTGAAFFRLSLPGLTTYANNVSVNLPSTDHDYHPYTGQTIPITLPGTVYGGSLDVVSGVLTVDRAIVDLGTLTWENINLTDGHVAKLTGDLASEIQAPPTSGTVTNAITSNYKMVSQNGIYTVDYSAAVNTAGRVIVRNNDTESNPEGTLVYYLATPVVYQLTPTEVTSLLKHNTIFANTGNTQATYVADPKTYIDQAIATAVAALS